MKFTEYITEVSKTTLIEYGVLKAISINCEPFIKEWKNVGAKQLLYRGTDKPLKKAIAEIIPRKERVPKDMPTSVHYAFDFMFNQ